MSIRRRVGNQICLETCCHPNLISIVFARPVNALPVPIIDTSISFGKARVHVVQLSLQPSEEEAKITTTATEIIQ